MKSFPLFGQELHHQARNLCLVLTRLRMGSFFPKMILTVLHWLCCNRIVTSNMITLIPADRQMTTSSSTAGQGGSMIDISPTNRRSSRGIFLIWLKRISYWVFGFWKNKVTESKNSFSNSSKLYISSFKSIFTLICHKQFLSSPRGSCLCDPETHG